MGLLGLGSLFKKQAKLEHLWMPAIGTCGYKRTPHGDIVIVPGVAGSPLSPVSRK